MITFTCPSCKAICNVGDEFAGRKMKCPKCRTRIRHHKDGQIEILTVGAPPPPAPATAGAAAPAASTEEVKKGSTVEIAVVPEMVKKLVSQSESKQNTIVIAGVVAFLILVLSGIGILIKEMILTVAPLAVGFTAAFVWLMMRARKRQEGAAAKLSKTAAKDEGKTEPIAKL